MSEKPPVLLILSFFVQTHLALHADLANAQQPSASQCIDDIEGQTSEFASDSLSSVSSARNVRYGDVVSYVDYAELLPAAPDPNYLLSSPFVPVDRLGAGCTLPASRYGFEALRWRIGGDVKLNGIYDTGFVQGDFRPSGVALQGTRASRQSGNFKLASGSGNLAWDVNLPKTSDNPQTQAYLKVEYNDDVLRARNVYGRLVNATENGGYWLFFAGKSQTFASDEAALPTSILNDVFPVGALQKKIVSASMESTPSSRLRLGCAIKNPGSDFLTGNAEDVKFSRYPTLVGRVRYAGVNQWDSYQLASTVRWFGLENTAGQEHWVTGWGVTGVARKMLIANQDALYMGFAGGNGPGDYIFGIDSAAGPGVAGLTPLSSLGAYAGLAHKWFGDDDCGVLWSNFVGGVSQQGNALFLPGDQIRHGRQAFANLNYRANANFALGVEYHYLARDVQNGMTGVNHRIQVVISLGTPATRPKQRATAFAERTEPADSRPMNLLRL